MLIKVCGITNVKDALLAVEHGAGALGFILFPGSPRFVPARGVEEIIARIPRDILTVAVFVANEQEIPPDGSWSALQLHGLRSESQIPKTNKRVIVATALRKAGRFPNSEILIDESRGTGKKADWQALAGLGRPFILSGGLNPDNVGEAIDLLKPAGIDVNSGVERSPGVKDPGKLKRFLEIAKNKS